MPLSLSGNTARAGSPFTNFGRSMTPSVLGEFGRKPDIFDLVRQYGNISNIPNWALPSEFQYNSGYMSGGSPRGGGGSGNVYQDIINSVGSVATGLSTRPSTGLRDTDPINPQTGQPSADTSVGNEDISVTNGGTSDTPPPGGSWEQAKDWLERNHPWLLPILAGVSGVLENRPSSSATTSTQEIDPNIIAATNAVFGGYQSLLNEDPKLTGMLANDMSTRNQGAEIERRRAIERAAQSGIFGPAQLGIESSIEGRRVAGNVQAQNQLPILAKQMRENTLAGFANAIAGAPYGSRTTGTVDASGNMAGGGVTGLTAMLAEIRGLNNRNSIYPYPNAGGSFNTFT